MFISFFFFFFRIVFIPAKNNNCKKKEKATLTLDMIPLPHGCYILVGETDVMMLISYVTI